MKVERDRMCLTRERGTMVQPAAVWYWINDRHGAFEESINGKPEKSPTSEAN